MLSIAGKFQINGTHIFPAKFLLLYHNLRDIEPSIFVFQVILKRFKCYFTLFPSCRAVLSLFQMSHLRIMNLYRDNTPLHLTEPVIIELTSFGLFRPLQ